MYNSVAKLFWLTGVFVIVLAASQVQAESKFNLKPGARGKVCLSCHDGFQETLKKSFVHTPLAKGECVGCHSPHSSNYSNLLARSGLDICGKCHTDLIPEDAKSVHEVVTNGECISCHDPHAADNKFNLHKAGKELCFDCHTELGEKLKSNKVPHVPVEKNCSECHTAHASADKIKLLKSDVPTLCIKCHDVNKKIFKKIHLNYPVEKANCTICHNPHGSNTDSMLFDNVHQPVSKRKCSQCHAEPGDADPFALKKKGVALCQSCHYELINETYNRDRIHWPIVDGKGCINCHAPHASSEKALLKAPTLTLCSECHADTMARQDRAQTKHSPISEGECMTCHSPHSSDNLFLLGQSSIPDLCGKCHEWKSHSTHPIGEDVVDPRNPNITVQCLSCHQTHGNEYKHFLHFELTKDMCVQCHIEYRR